MPQVFLLGNQMIKKEISSFAPQSWISTSKVQYYGSYADWVLGDRNQRQWPQAIECN